jgi:hypothetical protein
MQAHMKRVAQVRGKFFQRGVGLAFDEFTQQTQHSVSQYCGVATAVRLWRKAITFAVAM